MNTWYRICYLGSDGTEDLEFVFFEKAGRELIGKPVLTLIRSRAPRGMSVEDAIQYARADQSIPREFASVVSNKYRMVVWCQAKVSCQRLPKIHIRFTGSSCSM